VRSARAAVLVQPKTLELREFPLPAIGPDEALLRIEASGICGTDYEQYEGDVPPHEYYTPFPVVPGHEPLGIITEIGDRARERWGVSVGDRVAVRSGYGCGRCEACARYEPRACRTRGGTYGFTDVRKAPSLWGGYAEYMYLSPLSVVRRMDPSLPAEVAVLFNPLAAGLSWAWSVPHTRRGERVVILGSGQRGLCCVVAAREADASQIVITGLTRDAHKLAVARELGADLAIEVETTDVVTAVRDATGGGAHVVVDTTPFAPQSLTHAVAIAIRRGRIVLAGLKGRRPTPDLFADDIIYKELTVQGVLSMPYEDFERAVALIESRKYPLEKLHTHSFPIEQAEQAILTLAGAMPGMNAIHIAIAPGAPPVHLPQEGPV
jgi:threonine dehydrogenase-like Zn-dependent dehydrogenase